jgi:hypothetical protein
MTSPYILSDEATATIVDLLSSASDAKDALLPAPPIPAVIPPTTPPLAADVAPSPPASAYNGGYVMDAPGKAYGVYRPDMVPGAPGSSGAAGGGRAPAAPYVFPAQHPKPGENRILKPLGTHYAQEHNAAMSELEKREVLKKEKDPTVVRYVNDQKREKYHIEVGTVMKRNNAPFDTAKVKDKYLRNGKWGGYEMPYVTQEQGLEWATAGLIWVCVGDPKGTEKPRFFSHVGNPGRFHHSSLTRGGGVIGAGEWIIKEGALLKVSANSGHYQPTIDYLYHAVLQLAVAFRDQATMGGTTIFLFDKKEIQWIDYPVKEFIKAPTAGGRFTTHPSQM